MNPKDSKPPSSAVELSLFALRQVTRNPPAVVWQFALPPLVLCAVIGIAFTDKGPARLTVTVSDGPEAEQVAKALEDTGELTAVRASWPEAQERLRRGRSILTVVPGPTPELYFDPATPDSRAARLLVTDALQKRAGRQDRLQTAENVLRTPGFRYLDFLVPGLLGFSLMTHAFESLAYMLTFLRKGKFLKRLSATPMSRFQFLTPFVIREALTGVTQLVALLGFTHLAFDVQVQGPLWMLVGFLLFGALCFAGLGLLMGSRARVMESVFGLNALATLSMVSLSGVFFSVDKFPSWMQGAIRLLPLTALIDGLREIILGGGAHQEILRCVAVLSGWGIVSYLVTLKIFRWS